MRLLPLLALLALAAPVRAAEPPRDPYPWLGRSPAREPVYPEILITTRELAKQPEARRPLALDLRTAEAFARGHLPGARWLDLEPPIAAAIAARDPGPLAAWLGAQGIGAETPLLLYGDGLSQATLGRAFWALEWAGCAMPRILDGGIEAWLHQGGELQTGPAAPVGAPLPAPSPRPELGLDRAWVAARMGETHTCEILDLRGELAWADLAGHIPHALPFDPLSLLDPEGEWPEPATARAAFSRLGPRARDFVDLETTFVLAGENAADPLAGLAYLLLRLIDVKAAVQLGGWAAWRADPAAPTTRIVDVPALRAILVATNPELADTRQPRLPIFDLRGHRDFQREHLPGALALPAHEVDDSLSVLIAQQWPGLDPAADSLVFYCYGADCVRSRIAATKAARLGWRRTLIFQGGVPAWRKAALPLPGHGPQPSVPIPAGSGRP